MLVEFGCSPVHSEETGTEIWVTGVGMVNGQEGVKAAVKGGFSSWLFSCLPAFLWVLCWLFFVWFWVCFFGLLLSATI